jgi:hypothetical protein
LITELIVSTIKCGEYQLWKQFKKREHEYYGNNSRQQQWNKAGHTLILLSVKVYFVSEV